MAVSMKENGETTKCMEKALSPGQTVENMSVNILMIKSKDTESLFGPMAAVTRVIGKVANSTVREFTSLAKVMKSMENGKMASASDGLVAKMEEQEEPNEKFQFFYKI